MLPSYLKFRFLTKLLPALLVAVACGHAAEESGWVKAPQPAVLQAAAATETSGLAAAVRGTDCLWLVNDSGGEPALFLIGTDGRDRGKVRVEGARNLDWEDLASFSWRGKPYLLIADVGDNDGRRPACTLYIVPEPALPPAGGMLSGSVKPEWTLEFRYPNRPLDCEAVAVDAALGKVLLLSKRTSPPGVFELPLVPGKGGLLIARKIGQTDVTPPPGGFPHPFGAQPTGLDLSPDGSTAAVLSYVGVFVFTKGARESWAAAFARKPVILPRHGLPQAEAIAFSRDGKSLYAISEGARSRLISYQRQGGN
jgi:hypothetical protein